MAEKGGGEGILAMEKSDGERRVESGDEGGGGIDPAGDEELCHGKIPGGAGAVEGVASGVPIIEQELDEWGGAREGGGFYEQEPVRAGALGTGTFPEQEVGEVEIPFFKSFPKPRGPIASRRLGVMGEEELEERRIWI